MNKTKRNENEKKNDGHTQLTQIIKKNLKPPKNEMENKTKNSTQTE